MEGPVLALSSALGSSLKWPVRRNPLLQTQKSSPPNTERAPPAAGFQTALPTRILHIFLPLPQSSDVIFKRCVTSVGRKTSRLGQTVSDGSLSQCHHTAACLRRIAM